MGALRPSGSRRDALDAGATDLVIRLAFLGLFAWWSLELIRPFLSILIWAVLLAVALQPAHDWLARRLGGRRGLAAAGVTVAALATVLGPVSVLAASLFESVHWLAAGLEAGALRVPPPPAAVLDWQLVGRSLGEAWTLAATNLDEAIRRYGPAILPAGGSVLARAAALGGDVVRFLAAIVVAGFLFVPGPRLARGARAFAGRLIAPRGAHFIELAGATIRNVSRGVVGVALLQALLAGVILQLSGLPGAGLIAFAVLILCIVQIGPAPVLLPVLVWVWTAQPTSTALVLTLLLVPVGLLDNVLKPILMARGLSTPMPVIILGVFGGALTHGLAGLFLGPVVLSVFYELVVMWTRLGADAPAPGPELQ